MSSVLLEKAFSTCIGHTGEVSRLKRVLEGKRIPHAMLFSGPAGTGKRLIARSVAAVLLGHSRENDNSLQLAHAGSHPDLHLIQLEEEKKDIAVEQVRELISTLALKPYSASCSVAIVDEAHRMSIAACNALLKTLEEPNGHTYLILISEAAHRLPATIRSRCQTLQFGTLRDEEIRIVLSQLAAGELSPEELKTLTALCDGSLAPLELSSYIDPRSLHVSDAKAITEHLRQFSSRMDEFEKLLNRILAQKTSARHATALGIASEITSQKRLDPVFWNALYGTLRKQLRQHLKQNGSEWATVILEAVRAQQLITERNLSPQLQIASLFLRASDVVERASGINLD